MAAVGKSFFVRTQKEFEEIGEIDSETENKWQEKTKNTVKHTLEARIKEINTNIPNTIPSLHEKEILEQALAAI